MNRQQSNARIVKISRFFSLLVVFGALASWMLWEDSRSEAQSPATNLSSNYKLPDVEISKTVNAARADTIANDRGMQLGGFSDLWRAPTDPKGEFWIITDRGPNASVEVNDKKRRTFPVPDFTPLILHVRVDRDRLKLLETIPLVDKAGKPVTGIPNIESQDGASYSFTGKENLGVNPNGLDTEGLVRMPDGSFWVAEEYRPSLMKVSAKGKVEKRLVPEGTQLKGANYEVFDVLPAIYAKRQDNRGFEGLALSDDATILYAAVQSPLANPNEKAGEKSRNTRILAIDIEADRPAAEYVYEFDEAKDFESKAKPKDMKIGGVVFAGPNQLLVLERTDTTGKVYLVDLNRATNLLSTAHSSATGDAALEKMEALAKARIRPLPKRLVADLASIKDLPAKLEGLAIVDPQTIAVVNDNDFGFSGFNEAGMAISNGVKSNLLLIRLPASLPSR